MLPHFASSQSAVLICSGSVLIVVEKQVVYMRTKQFNKLKIMKIERE